MYLTEELLIDDNLEIIENEWIKESVQIVDDNRYNVYSGVGNNSLIKLLINEELLADI